LGELFSRLWALSSQQGRLCGPKNQNGKNKMTEKNQNEFSPLLGQIIRIESENHKLPLFGRLISVSDQFLTIERVDGRTTIIRRKAVLAAEPVKNQYGDLSARTV
jgi:hypothetical protein